MNASFFSAPILIYEIARVARKPTLGPAMLSSVLSKYCYRTAALSAAGKGYGKVVDLRSVREQEERDVDDRDEGKVEGLATIGAVGGL